MPNSKIPHTNITDNLNLQRLRHNQLIDSVGDVSTLVTTSKNITGAVNEVAGKFTAADSSPAFAGNVTVGGKLRVVGDARMQGDVVVGGALRIGDADTDTVSFSADVTSNIIPDVDNNFDIGDSTKEWRHGFFDGTLNADRLLADSGTITGNLDVQGITTLDSTTIGGSLTVNDSAVFSGQIRASGGLVAASATLSGVTIVGNQRVADPYVVVNDGIAVNNANRPGLAVDRPGTDSAVVYFNENTDRWQAGLKTGPLDIIRETDSARLSGLSVGGIPSTFSNWNSAYTTSLTSILDADFSTNGLMKRTGSGSYSIVADKSSVWDSAIVDGDFTSNGLMKRTGAGTYTSITDNSSNWDTAFSYGNHASAGYLTPTDSATLTNKTFNSFSIGDGHGIYDTQVPRNEVLIFDWKHSGTPKSFIGMSNSSADGSGGGSNKGVSIYSQGDSANVDLVLESRGAGDLVLAPGYANRTLPEFGGSHSDAANVRFEIGSLGQVVLPVGKVRLGSTTISVDAQELNMCDIGPDGFGVTSDLAFVHTDVSGDVRFSEEVTVKTINETHVTTSGSGTQDLNQESANVFIHTSSGNTTFTFSNPPSATYVHSFTVIHKQDGSGGHSITWPGTVDWPGGSAPSVTSSANAVDVFTFITYDGGTSYYGFLAGSDVK